MNFAFSTFVIFIFILPGIIALRSYYSTSSVFSINTIKINFAEEIFKSFIPAIFIHIFVYFIFCYPWGYRYYFDHILAFLFGTSDTNLIKDLSVDFQKYGIFILIYNCLAWFSAFLFGNFARINVMRFSLDIVFHHLRFQNKWVYIFIGKHISIFAIEQSRYSFFEKVKLVRNVNSLTRFINERTPSVIILDILVIVGDKKIIYSGYLNAYYFTDNGDLDRIVLYLPSKRELYVDSNSKFIPIDGKYLVIPYSEMKNLNFRYYKLTEEHMKSI